MMAGITVELGKLRPTFVPIRVLGPYLGLVSEQVHRRLQRHRTANYSELGSLHFSWIVLEQIANHGFLFRHVAPVARHLFTERCNFDAGKRWMAGSVHFVRHKFAFRCITDMAGITESRALNWIAHVSHA